MQERVVVAEEQKPRKDKKGSKRNLVLGLSVPSIVLGGIFGAIVAGITGSIIGAVIGGLLYVVGFITFKTGKMKTVFIIPAIAIIMGSIAFSFTSISGVSLITGNSVSRVMPFVWLVDSATHSVVRWSLGIFLFSLIAVVAVFLWFPGRSIKTSRWIAWKCVKTSAKACSSLLKVKRR